MLSLSSRKGLKHANYLYYDLAEKAYPYQNIRGGERTLNEDEHRR